MQPEMKPDVVMAAATQGIDPTRAWELLSQRGGPEAGGGAGRACPCHTGGAGDAYCLPVAGDKAEVGPRAPTVTTHDMRGIDVPELVRLLRAMQTERVESYAMFEEGFRRFLEELSAPQYERICAQVTTEFAHISGAINALEAALGECGADSLAKLARGLQALEKRKLSVTVERQLVRRELRVAELRSAVDAEAASLVGERHAQEELLRAGLAELVGEINEVMDEVQCELTELLDED
ncbi:DNA repair REX1-B-domain-containing protein [Pavlovales sp. CCMP2436]|nr:DNA repair REX1-B-domain-containing protein [Pavlovales sp. CCMP2436]|mmetsp:Transcript_5271/g.12590  ORF Transcript_5271/g.12590 Transcript_5271/m.12590 type:complete len:237 (-) Transcript_5271:54-764(-)